MSQNGQAAGSKAVDGANGDRQRLAWNTAAAKENGLREGISWLCSRVRSCGRCLGRRRIGALLFWPMDRVAEEDPGAYTDEDGSHQALGIRSIFSLTWQPPRRVGPMALRPRLTTGLPFRR